MKKSSFRNLFQITVMATTLAMTSDLFAMQTSVDHPDTPEVMMNEYIFTNSNNFESVQTYGASTCVVVVLYHSKSQTGALAHVSAETDIKGSVKKMIRDFNKIGLQAKDIKAELHGGWKNSSDQMVIDLKNALIKMGVSISKNETLKFIGPNLNDLFTLPEPQPGISHVISLQLHLASGQVTNYTESIPSLKPSSGPDSQPNLNNVLYRHDESL